MQQNVVILIYWSMGDDNLSTPNEIRLSWYLLINFYLPKNIGNEDWVVISKAPETIPIHLVQYVCLLKIETISCAYLNGRRKTIVLSMNLCFIQRLLWCFKRIFPFFIQFKNHHWRIVCEFWWWFEFCIEKCMVPILFSHRNVWWEIFCFIWFRSGDFVCVIYLR